MAFGEELVRRGGRARISLLKNLDNSGRSRRRGTHVSEGHALAERRSLCRRHIRPRDIGARQCAVERLDVLQRHRRTRSGAKLTSYRAFVEPSSSALERENDAPL